MRQNCMQARGTEALVKRQICGIFTRGLVPNSNASNEAKADYDSRWVLALYSEYRTLAQGVRAGSKVIN